MTPPPASTALKQYGQWSRPALALIFGVRPNSPIAMTSVESSKPRSARSLISAAYALIGRRQQVVLEPREHVLVGVPVRQLAVDLVVVHRDEAHPRLPPSRRKEHALPVLGAAVTVAQPRVFLVETQPAERPPNGENATPVSIEIRSPRRRRLLGERLAARSRIRSSDSR